MLCVTRHGLREMVVGSIVLAAIAALLAFVKPSLALIVMPFWAFLFAFFRDPDRPSPHNEHVMVSPADGTVTDITDLPACDLLDAPALRIGIFLSVFNVHVNRSPCDGRVAYIQYKPGKFINAMRCDEASKLNESNTLVISDLSDNRPIAAVKQIAGLIARRIVCTAAVGDILQRGQRIGMIKFGSRTELYIAKWLDPHIQVAVGQKVRGAVAILAVLRKAPAPTKPTLTEQQAP